MLLVDLYVRWKLSKRMKAWKELINTHFYVTNDEVQEVKNSKIDKRYQKYKKRDKNESI